MKYITIVLLLAIMSSGGEYSRSKFKHWIDSDHDCQPTRDEVLISESNPDSLILSDNGCKVIHGYWNDPYTGRVFTNPRMLDVDHLVPLKEAWLSGASSWTPQKRKEYANNMKYNDHLVAVYRGANRSKGAKDPSKWMPIINKCWYLDAWTQIKQEWGLTYDTTELESISTLNNIYACNISF